MLVRNGDRILLIERARGTPGFALPAGHIDGDAYEDAAKRELMEEVGLTADTLVLLGEGRKENICRRADGSWHYWKIYEATATGEIVRSQDETKRAGWCTKEEVQELAARTERYNREEIDEEEWRRSPGLEPVMYEWFTELGLLK